MITIDQQDGIAQLTFAAPPLNILTRALLRDLRAAIETAQGYAGVRVLLLQSEGRHFSAGASVEEHMPDEFRNMLDDFAAAVQALHDFPLPVIAAVQGRCLGGGFELVQAADLVIAADDAQFAQPEINLGVMAPVACALLPDRVGRARAAELLFTGDPMTAGHALTAGLVARVVPAAELCAQSLAFAARIARHSATALRMTKQALRGAAGSIEPRVSAANALYADRLMTTHDALEGLQAFVQKRTPQWSHQ